MNFKRFYLIFREKLYHYLHKDSMPYKLELYRMNGAIIGENVRAFSPITSPEAYLIKIGNNVTVSTGVKFCTHDNSAIKVFEDATDFVGKIEVGDNSFIGMNAILMGGVKIPNNCIVGAGSVVTKSFKENGCVLAGNPARIIGTVESIQEKRKDNIFNFRGLNKQQKEKVILEHPERFLIK